MPENIFKNFSRVSELKPEYFRLIEQVRRSRALYFENAEELKRLYALGWEVKNADLMLQIKYTRFWLNSWERWFDRLTEYTQREDI